MSCDHLGLPNMRTALIVGGAPLANQIYRLKSGIQIVIATTDRLLDILIEHGEYELCMVEILMELMFKNSENPKF